MGLGLASVCAKELAEGVEATLLEDISQTGVSTNVQVNPVAALNRLRQRVGSPSSNIAFSQDLVRGCE
jgi:hypothetical protein